MTETRVHPIVRQLAGLLLIVLCLAPLLWSIYISIRNELPPSTPVPVSSIVAKREGPQFAMAVLIDHNGNAWVGSEDEGIWERDAIAGKWRQFAVRDGLGDNNGYAMAEDRLGRIWVGHLNHGVSV